MYVLPMCVTVYKIFPPIHPTVFSMPLNTLAVVPFIGDITKSYGGPVINENEMAGIRLRVPGGTGGAGMVQEFENLLVFNNYEMVEKSDHRAVTWCHKNSKGGENLLYNRKVQIIKTKNGRRVKADVELNNFVQNYKTNSVQLANEVLKSHRADRCREEIIHPRDNIIKKASQLQGRICDPEMITALMETGLLRATGKFSTITSKSNKAKHTLEFDEPLMVKNFVDFNGTKSISGISRLIGYQGELRILEYHQDQDEILDLCTKFAANHAKQCSLTEYRYDYLKSTHVSRRYKYEKRIIKLGALNPWRLHHSKSF